MPKLKVLQKDGQEYETFLTGLAFEMLKNDKNIEKIFIFEGEVVREEGKPSLETIKNEIYDEDNTDKQPRGRGRQPKTN